MALGLFQNLYLQQISNWNYDFCEYFLYYDFATNCDAQISTNYYPKVIEYITNKVVKVSCLDDDNFYFYLQKEENKTFDTVSYISILQAVSRYTTLTFDYYFRFKEACVDTSI